MFNCYFLQTHFDSLFCAADEPKHFQLPHVGMNVLLAVPVVLKVLLQAAQDGLFADAFVKLCLLRWAAWALCAPWFHQQPDNQEFCSGRRRL